MTKRFERGAVRWHPGLLAPDFFADLRCGIVGFAIEVKDVQAKLKLSQNRLWSRLVQSTHSTSATS